MQAYELVEILSDALNRLSKIGIKVTDSLKQLEAKGAKKEYIVQGERKDYNSDYR